MSFASLPSPFANTGAYSHFCCPFTLHFTLRLLLSNLLCHLFCCLFSRLLNRINWSLDSEMCHLLWFVKIWSSRHSSGICKGPPQEGSVHHRRLFKPLSLTTCLSQQQHRQRALDEIEGYLLHWNEVMMGWRWVLNNGWISMADSDFHFIKPVLSLPCVTSDMSFLGLLDSVTQFSLPWLHWNLLSKIISGCE